MKKLSLLLAVVVCACAHLPEGGGAGGPVPKSVVSRMGPDMAVHRGDPGQGYYCEGTCDRETIRLAGKPSDCVCLEALKAACDAKARTP